MEQICWLRITDYMREWTRTTLGNSKRVKDEPVLDILSLEGVQSALLMPTSDGLPGFGTLGNAMCDTWHAALTVGLEMDAQGMEKEFSITREMLEQYLPVACPAIAITMDGSTHPWNRDTCFGKQQASAVLRLIRDAFWSAVGNYAVQYENAHFGTKYAQIDMLESFCKDYRINDTYLEAMRREWQRRCKRVK